MRSSLVPRSTCENRLRPLHDMGCIEAIQNQTERRKKNYSAQITHQRKPQEQQ
jgi:hypothetical protein